MKRNVSCSLCCNLICRVCLVLVMFAGFVSQAGAVLLHHVETENVPQANDGFVLVSPDGKHVYTNSNDVLRVFRQDADTGAFGAEIQMIGADDIQAGTSFFPGMAVLSSNGADLYVQGAYGFAGAGPNDYAESVMHFRRDAATGLLTYQERLYQGKDFQDYPKTYVSPVVSPDGHFVYVASASGIFVFKRDSNGALGFVEVVKKDSNGESLRFLGHPAGGNTHFSPALSPDGKNLYVTALRGKLFVFSRDATTGKLTALQTFRHDELTGTGGDPVVGLERSEGIAVTADGRFVYVTGKEKRSGGEGDDVVLTFSRDPGDGRLTFVGSVKGGVFDGTAHSMLWPQKLVLGPEADEKFLYVATLHGVNVFRRNQDGSLHWLERFRTTALDDMAMSPDGKNLYAKGANSTVGIPVLDISTDLSVVKTDSVDPVAPSGNFSYTLAVTNNGPADALNVVVTDTLPAGVGYVSGSVNAPRGSCSESGGTVTCNMGKINNTGAVTATIEVTAPAVEGTITNTASVSGDQADTKTGDNTDSEKTEVNVNGGSGVSDWLNQGASGGSSAGGGGGLGYGLLLLTLGAFARRRTRRA